MMMIELPRDRSEDFRRKWKIRELMLFGSVLREDFRPDSDVDVLVTFEPDARHSLFDLIQIEDELSELLGRKIDLVEKSRIQNPFIRHHALSGDRAPLRPEDRDPAYLYELRKYARDAWEFAGKATREQLAADEVLQDALCYVLQKLGRFAGKVSPTFRAAHPEIPWERLALREGWIFRREIGVDLLWSALRDDVPGLADKLDRLVPPLPQTASDEPGAAVDTASGENR